MTYADALLTGRRRPQATGLAADTTSLANIEALFAQCTAADPTNTPDPAEACSPDVVALRIDPAIQ